MATIVATNVLSKSSVCMHYGYLDQAHGQRWGWSLLSSWFIKTKAPVIIELFKEDILAGPQKTRPRVCAFFFVRNSKVISCLFIERVNGCSSKTGSSIWISFRVVTLNVLNKRYIYINKAVVYVAQLFFAHKSVVQKNDKIRMGYPELL
jgi:hypothetical protein